MLRTLVPMLMIMRNVMGVCRGCGTYVTDYAAQPVFLDLLVNP